MWAYLGNNMPSAAIADLEIHEGTMDLVVATHGRGIYKINLHPIHAMITQNLPLNEDHFFDVPETELPRVSPHSRLPDYLSFEKTSIPFWLSEAKSIALSLKDKDQKIVWTTSLQGQKGFNEYRWDLVLKKEIGNGNSPYYVNYDRFLESGNYTLILSDGKADLEQIFVVNKIK